jgi:uncharacterized membrane protein YdbT with pleckstrin-like domain
MSYIDKNLIANEKIIFRTRKHFIIFLGPIVWAILAIVCLLSGQPIIMKIAIAPGIAALVTGINQLLLYYSSDFVITDRRLFMKEGIFFRHSNETRLTTVANVNIQQNLLGQILNYGTVTINSFGGERDPFSMISRPIEFRKQLETQVDKLVR